MNILNKIKEHWEHSASVDIDEQGLRPTARDPYLQEEVEAAIEKWLYPKARILDLGCGDGLSTIRFAKHVSSAVGVDYIDRYVEKAKSNALEHNCANVIFGSGNVLDLNPLRQHHEVFDIVTSIRCLINLGTWENQAHALGEIAACVAPGGLYLASEGWEEGMDELNRMRLLARLPAINTAAYNLLLKRSAFESEVRKNFEIISYVNLGFYLFMSRVFQPAFVEPEHPQHDHPINRTAALLQHSCRMDEVFRSCDYAGVYVLRRLG